MKRKVEPFIIGYYDENKLTAEKNCF